MAVPTIVSVDPTAGPASGGALVRLVGSGFAPGLAVRFGGVPAVVVAVREGEVDVRTPAHEAGLVAVELENAGGAVAVLADAYRFEREVIAREATLTRLVRQLLRELKRQVLANVSVSVSVDYSDADDGVVAMATLPSLVLSGPSMRENRFYSTNVMREDLVAGSSGPEVVRHRSPLTVDLAFTLTAASERTAELLNLMAAVATFVNRNRWLELLRDPDDATQGVVRWEMVLDGDLRTQTEGRNDVRAFTWGLVVRGFDVDEGLPFDVTGVVGESAIEITGAGDSQ